MCVCVCMWVCACVCVCGGGVRGGVMGLVGSWDELGWHKKLFAVFSKKSKIGCVEEKSERAEWGSKTE